MKKYFAFYLMMVGIIVQARAACSTCGSTGASTSGIDAGPCFYISMGNAQYGQSAGSLSFSATLPNALLFRPVSLQYDGTNRTDVSVITTNVTIITYDSSVDTVPEIMTNITYVTNSLGGGTYISTNMEYFSTNVVVTNTTSLYVTNLALRQVFAPQVLADIPSPPTTNGYAINFYFPTNVIGTNGDGSYQLSGTPFKTWIVTNRDSTTLDELQVSDISTADGLLKQWNYSYLTNTGTWVLETRAGIQASSTITNIDAYVYQNINTLQYSNGPVVRQTKTTYQLYGWGYAPIQIDEGSSDAPETTTISYYPSPEDFHSGSMALKQRVVHPDGSQENYTGYTTNGLPTGVYTTFADDSHGRYTTYDYDPAAAGITGSGDDGTIHPDVPRQVIQYVNNNEVGHNYSIFPSAYLRLDVQCTTDTLDWNDSDNLFTTNRYFSSGTNEFRLQSVIRPDGTMSTYDYNASGPYWTNITATGQPDSGYSYIVDGVSNRTVVNQWGNMVSSTSWDIRTGAVLAQDIYGSYDIYGRPQRVAHLDGTTETNVYACCGLNYSTDRDGVNTVYLYDDDKRQVGYEKFFGTDMLTYNNSLNAAGQVIKSTRVGTDSSEILMNGSAYDLAGELIAQTNALNGVTYYGRTNDPSYGGLIRTTINPDGSTRTNFYYADGSLKAMVGMAVHPVRYEYGVDYDANNNICTYSTEIKLKTDGTASSEWTKTYTDRAGRTTEVKYADNHYSQSFYNSKGQLSKQIDPDGDVTLYQYDPKGSLAYTAISLSHGSTIDFYNDRITWTTNDVVSDHGTNVRRSSSYVWAQNGANTSSLISISEVLVNGLDSWQVKYADITKAVTNETHVSYSGSSRRMLSVAPDGYYATNVYSYGRLTSSKHYDSGNVQIGGTTYTYDAHERQYQATDARNGTTTYGYNNADQVNVVTTPAPGGSGSPETTTTLFDTMMRPYSVIQPDGTTVNTIYLSTGELGLQYGSRTYPVGYSYDYAGRMKTMTNWSTFSTQTGARVTTWNYDADRGWLTSKTYADGIGPSYTYTDAGRLASRTWVRGVDTSYAYDNGGSLTGVSYSDSTPAVTYTYDRLGRQATSLYNGITDTMTYDLANDLLTESFSGGTQNGLSVTNGYDQFLRRTNLVSRYGTTPLASAIYGYDYASRLSTVSDGTDNAAYTYVANSPLVSQIVFKQGSTPRMTTVKSYDYLNRLTQISNVPSAGVAANFNYSYNSANQRTQDKLVDGSYWIYQYDSLGQVTSGVKYFADGSVVPGQQFGYQFDDIGNRKQTTAGGDATGSGLRLASYSVNNLNQITARDYPGTNDVLGAALATNTVSVNGQTAWRKGEYFWSTVKTNNASAPQWQNVTTASGGKTNTGGLYLPMTPEQFSYDADGNLTNDGRWAYTWDGENRLIGMTVNTNVGPQYQLSFGYDFKGRRIQKLVATNGVALSTNNFLYDGWNLVAELKPNNTLLRSYVWGTDLSGSIQGAGGVGGLLEVSYYGSSTTNCFPAFDGNGNIMALVNAADGTLAANYDYAAFGEPIRITGVMARNNPFRFSTKYADDESDLLYYGYRYYKPSTGTWPNRDPIGEPGFEAVANRPEVAKKTAQMDSLKQLLELIQKINPELVGDFRNQANLNSAPSVDQNTVNLYAFVQNNPVSQIDSFGLDGEATLALDPTLLMDEEAAKAYAAKQCRCALLAAAVQVAKKAVGALGGPKSGDSCAVLKAKTAAWVVLAVARSRLNNVCFSGGDPGHQQATADAWTNVGKCIALQTEKGCVGSPTGK